MIDWVSIGSETADNINTSVSFSYSKLDPIICNLVLCYFLCNDCSFSPQFSDVQNESYFWFSIILICLCLKKLLFPERSITEMSDGEHLPSLIVVRSASTDKLIPKQFIAFILVDNTSWKINKRINIQRWNQSLFLYSHLNRRKFQIDNTIILGVRTYSWQLQYQNKTWLITYFKIRPTNW